MSEEDKTIETPAAPAEESKLQAENKTLSQKNRTLLRDLAQASKREEELTKQLTSAEQTIKTLETLSKQRSEVTHDGVTYKVVEIDTAAEIADKMRKSCVDQDAPVAVLERL